MRYIDADKLLELYDYQELNEMINAYARKGVDKKKWNIPIGVVKQNIKDMPTADVRENVGGEWIEDNPREKSMMWRCSVCGRIAYYPIIGERKSYKKHCGYNFCPNCGAEMRGEDNGRDEENHNRV